MGAGEAKNECCNLRVKCWVGLRKSQMEQTGKQMNYPQGPFCSGAVCVKGPKLVAEMGVVKRAIGSKQ